MRLIKKRSQALRDDGADIVHLEQLSFSRLHDRVELAKMFGQLFRSALADMPHAQPEQEARQGRLLRFFERIDDVPRGLVRHAIERSERREAELVKIGQGADEVGVDQLFDQLVAKAFDLDCTTRRKVQYRFFALGCTKEAAGTAIVDFVLFPHRVRTANGALARHRENQAALRFRQCGAVGRQSDDFGNHIAGAAHDHRVADTHILASRFVLVVQRGVGHRDAADKYWRQLGHRRQLAGSPHLDLDRLHRRQLLLRRVLVRHRPTWLPRHKAQSALQLDAVDLVDHTVDVVRQSSALPPDIFVKRDELEGTVGSRRLRGDRKAPRMKLVEPIELRRAIRPALLRWCDLAQPVSEETQGPGRGDRRIELSHRTGGRIARIDKHFLVLLAGRDLLALALVERVEIRALHVDLAAHFDHRRRLADEPQGNLLDGADVLRHFFADLAIAPRRSLHQQPVFIAQIDGETIELELAHIGERRRVFGQPELAPHPRIERAGSRRCDVRLCANRKHRHGVADLDEAVEHFAADPLCWRIGCAKVGVLGFDRLQPLKQRVVLGVGQFRRVEHVVQVGVVA